ncbi:DUF5995 family protein [Nocardia terpenica]|nr:DUF5995 family protein [Nocardia terpenica]NQE93738.1 hypothetical protein [Nocardia terpenica]
MRTAMGALVVVLALVTLGNPVAVAQPPAQPQNSVGSGLLQTVAGLPPIQALAEITRQLFGPDGRYIPWARQLPPLPVPHTPQATPCPSGGPECITHVIQEMQRRGREMIDACSDNAPMLLSYLTATRATKNITGSPGEFEDPAFLRNWDLQFADYYFRALDDYYHGRRDAVPGAWRQAFQAADTHSVTVLADAVLGYNAHITRDLPFVIADIGVTAPDGTSRKRDHERASQMLTEYQHQVLTALTGMYEDADPTMRAGANLEPMVYMSFTQVIQAWREYAWRAAEQLLLAPTPADRAAVADQIENLSQTLSQIIVQLFTRNDPPPHQGPCAKPTAELDRELGQA